MECGVEDVDVKTSEFLAKSDRSLGVILASDVGAVLWELRSFNLCDRKLTPGSLFTIGLIIGHQLVSRESENMINPLHLLQENPSTIL